MPPLPRVRAGRSTYHYRSRKDGPAVLRKRIREIAETRVHYGYRRIPAYIAPRRARHGETNPSGKRRRPKGSRVAAMATKLKPANAAR